MRRPEERPGSGAAAAEERAGSGPPRPPAPRAPRLLGGAAAAMFSVLSYGRLVARAVLGGLSQTDPRAGGGGGGDYGLVTAGCGFGKDFRKGLLKKGACYGDDACFVARHRSADVLGESPARGPPPQPRIRLLETPLLRASRVLLLFLRAVRGAREPVVAVGRERLLCARRRAKRSKVRFPLEQPPF